MKKKFFPMLAAILLFMAIPVTGKAEDKNKSTDMFEMQELTIQILPEYAMHPEIEDEKEYSVLSVYRGTLKNVSGSDQEGTVEIPLPMDGKDFLINYVGDYNQDYTQMYDIEYEVDEENNTISWKTSETVPEDEHYKFVIEFFTTEIEKDGNKRSLDYKFTNFTETEMLNIYFVEPLKTTKFDLTPDADAHQQNSTGMNLFYYNLNDLEVGESLDFDLKYERSEDLTSVEILEELHVGVAGYSDNETSNLKLIIGIIVAVSVLAIAILIYILSNRNKGQKKPTSKQKNKNKENDHKNTEEKVARLRAMLVEGHITEEEYEELVKKIGG